MAHINTAKNDPNKTWRLINGLTSRKTSINSIVKAIKHQEGEFTNPLDAANIFNNYFTMIGDNLASSGVASEKILVMP